MAGNTKLVPAEKQRTKDLQMMERTGKTLLFLWISADSGWISNNDLTYQHMLTLRDHSI